MDCDLWLHFGPFYTWGHLETPGSQTVGDNVPMLRTCIHAVLGPLLQALMTSGVPNLFGSKIVMIYTVAWMF